jgi:hypothetical protein
MLAEVLKDVMTKPGQWNALFGFPVEGINYERFEIVQDAWIGNYSPP